MEQKNNRNSGPKKGRQMERTGKGSELLLGPKKRLYPRMRRQKKPFN